MPWRQLPRAHQSEEARDTQHTRPLLGCELLAALSGEANRAPSCHSRPRTGRLFAQRPHTVRRAGRPSEKRSPHSCHFTAACRHHCPSALSATVTSTAPDLQLSLYQGLRLYRRSYAQGREVGSHLRVCKTSILVLRFTKHCIIFHMNNWEPTFAPPWIDFLLPTVLGICWGTWHVPPVGEGDTIVIGFI